jgi:peptidoglycan/xylan/chitin deacetylase (PgdA/CDA1 family)
MAWLLALALLLGAAPAADATTQFVTLAFHDVVDSPGDLAADAITVQNLAAYFDWLRDQGYRVVSIDDVLAAHRGERPLPPRAVLLSFDDGYASIYTRVFPLLQAFSYPAVFAIVGSWIEPPEGTRLGDAAGGPPRARFASWEELREMRRSGLVEIASHTYGLHTEVPGNVEGSRYPAAVARAYGKRGHRTDIVHIVRPPSPQPRFGDVLQLLASPYSRFVELAGRLVGTALDHAYDPRTGRYETDAEYAERVRADLARSSAQIEARVGVRPRVVVWPYGRYHEIAIEAARAEGMPVTLTLDPERSDARDPSRIARFYPAQNPDLKALAGMLEKTPEVELVRGLCLPLDELNAATAEEREARLGRAIDLVSAFQPSLVLLGAASSGGGVYFPNDRLPVRADLFGRATWQLRTRAGVGVYAELPLTATGTDVEAMPAVYEALAKAVPFDGLSLGAPFLAGDLRPGPAVNRIGVWDPPAPRRVRADQDAARLPESGRLALAAIRAVSRYQPAVPVLDAVRLEALQPAREVGLDAVDYLAVRWDGEPKRALRTLREKGWLDVPYSRRLVYQSARPEPAVWRTVQAAGVVHGIYCPERLLDRPETLAALRPVLGAAWYPFRPR